MVIHEDVAVVHKAGGGLVRIDNVFPASLQEDLAAAARRLSP